MAEWGALRESVNQNLKKLAPTSPRSPPTGPAVPGDKCERTNQTTPKCRVGANKCMWCGSTKCLITACPQRLRVVERTN